MHAFLSIILTCCLAASAAAEVPYILEREFKNCMERGYSEKEFLRFYQVLDSLERRAVDFTEFKNYKIYTSNINRLLNANNYYQKGIAYRLVASLRDKEFNELLLERMKMEDNKFLKTLNAASIMRLMPTQTTVAFDYLIDHEDLASSPLTAVYLAMDAKSIVKTGYLRLHDSRPKAKVFALQTIARFDTGPEVDSVIIKAIRDWDINIKGYAIVALGIHQRGEYKDILLPYLKEPQLREVILETMQNSETETDVLYAEELKRRRR